MQKKVAETQADDAWVPTLCVMCYMHCTIKVHRKNGVAVKIEGNATNFATQGRICPKGNSGIMRLYDPARVKKPLKRTNPEKGVGVDPGWVEISWDEAMATVLERLKRIRETDPYKLAVGGFHSDSYRWNFNFSQAFGTPHGFLVIPFSGMAAMCGNGAHRPGLMVHGSENTHPDVEHARYIMIVGGGAMEAFQNTVPYNRQLAEARERGAKLVVVDPQQSRAAMKADEWVPIRPTTDGALIFGIMYTLVHELGIYDAEYLKKFTNACYLIGEDKYPVRDPKSGKPLIWDPEDGQAKAYNDPTIKNFALEGTYDTPGGRGRPAFEIFKEHIRKYTPEWASAITSVPAPTIRRLAKEFGEAAQIGSTIVIDGVTYPYRPASMAGYRGIGAHTNGFHNVWTMEMANMLIGSCRAVGGAGTMGGGHVAVAPVGDGVCTGIMGPGGFVDKMTLGPEDRVTYPPKTITMYEYFPMSLHNGMATCEAQAHPERYNFTPIDTLIYVYGNPLMSGQNQGLTIEALKKIPFIVDVTVYLDETAQFADMILPDTTYLEHWDLSHGGFNLGQEGILIQRPVVEPLHDTRPWVDVCIEIARELGFLTGPGGLTARMSNSFGTSAWDINKPYQNAREYVEELVESHGDKKDLVWEQGHLLIKVGPESRYVPAFVGGHRLPFYATHLMKMGDDLRAYCERNNVFQETVLDERILFEYSPLPFFFPSVIEEEPSEYDLYVINWKSILGSVGSGTTPATNVWLQEIAERDPYVTKILLNRETAKRKNLLDNDWVWVESPHGKMKGRLKLTEGIHPEVIGTIAMFGHHTDHVAGRGKVMGHFNSLLGSGLRYHGPSSLGCETAARARIYKA